MIRLFRAIAVLLLLLPGPAAARSSLAPGDLAGFAFTQRLGARLPLDAALTDETGRSIRLGEIFGTHPVLLVFGYFRCPNLCGLVRASLLDALGKIDLRPGRDFEIAVIGVDPREGPAEAAQAKRDDLARFGRAGTAPAWHYLTGAEAPLRRLAAAAGFPFRYDPAIDQYAHPAGLVLAASDGTILRYLPGIDHAPRDIRLGLIEASRGAIASPAARLLLLCYGYDPATGRYTFAVENAMRAVGIAVAGGLALFILGALRRERRR